MYCGQHAARNLFGPLKQHLGGRRFHSIEDVEIAVPERLRILEPDFYCDGIFALSSWEKCMNVLGDCVRK